MNSFGESRCPLCRGRYRNFSLPCVALHQLTILCDPATALSRRQEVEAYEERRSQHTQCRSAPMRCTVSPEKASEMTPQERMAGVADALRCSECR